MAARRSNAAERGAGLGDRDLRLGGLDGLRQGAPGAGELHRELGGGEAGDRLAEALAGVAGATGEGDPSLSSAANARTYAKPG